MELEEGLEEYPRRYAFFGNVVMLIWIGLGFMGCWYLSPLLAWAYLVLALLMVYVVLRKLVCTNCIYYGKWCSIGWGKLSALMFKRGDPEKFKDGIGIKMAPLTYGPLTLIPLIAVIISILQVFTMEKALVLVLILLIGGYSGTISRKKSCSQCRMRGICPGSAVR
jgi:hypothetical protein